MPHQPKTRHPQRKRIYYTADEYNFEVFLSLITNIFLEAPCILCGEVHPIHVHAKFTRLVRSNETEKNEPILIFSIICKNAKEQGRQYTKRILPFFRDSGVEHHSG